MLIRNFTYAIVILGIFIGCEDKTKNEEVNPVIGNWIVERAIDTWSYGIGTFADTVDYSTDNLASTPIVEIDKDNMAWCENNVCDDTYYCESEAIITLGESTIETDSLTVEFHFDNDKLILHVDYSEYGETYTSDLYLVEYTGDIPPSVWQNPADDTYEPDNEISSASNIDVNTSQTHILLCGDSDWFSFNADLSTRYIITITSDFDSYLELYDSAGNWILSDDDTYGFDAEIDWICSASGTYYFKVRAYNYSDEESGVYTISVSTTSTLQSVQPPVSGKASVKKAERGLFKKALFK